MVSASMISHSVSIHPPLFRYSRDSEFCIVCASDDDRAGENSIHDLKCELSLSDTRQSGMHRPEYERREQRKKKRIKRYVSPK